MCILNLGYPISENLSYKIGHFVKWSCSVYHAFLLLKIFSPCAFVFMFYSTELLHDRKGQEQDTLESAKDWPSRSFWAKPAGRFHHIYRKWMFWSVEADTWGEQVHRWTKICYNLLWNYWYVDPQYLAQLPVDKVSAFILICYSACLILGFIKFLGPYYMLLITKRRQIGAICGHTVYAVSKSEMIPLPNSSAWSSIYDSKNENRSLQSPLLYQLYFLLITWMLAQGMLSIYLHIIQKRINNFYKYSSCMPISFLCSF